MNDPVEELKDRVREAVEKAQLTGQPINTLTKSHIEQNLRQMLIGKVINKTSVITDVTAERIGDTSEYSVSLILDPPLDYFVVELPEGVDVDEQEEG